MQLKGDKEYILQLLDKESPAYLHKYFHKSNEHVEIQLIKPLASYTKMLGLHLWCFEMKPPPFQGIAYRGPMREIEVMEQLTQDQTKNMNHEEVKSSPTLSDLLLSVTKYFNYPITSGKSTPEKKNDHTLVFAK